MKGHGSKFNRKKERRSQRCWCIATWRSGQSGRHFRHGPLIRWTKNPEFARDFREACGPSTSRRLLDCRR